MVERVETVLGRLYVPYHNWYGKTASRFFQELRDNKKIFGTRCQSCAKTYLPPRAICPECFEKLDSWVELPPKGILTAYTVVNYTYSEYYQPRKAPYVLGIIRLDGADTGICHLVDEVDPARVFIGMRLEAVFSEKKKGDILDIAYFRPAGSQ